MPTTLLRGGMVIDGSGAKAERAEVLIADDKITAVGDVSPSTADEVIDVGGLVVAPGFIDAHTHSDWYLLEDPLATPKVAQGVTTEILGNCGFGPFPVRTDAARGAMAALLVHQTPPTFSSLTKYRQALGQRGTAVNVAALAPHGAIRANVVGSDDRPARSVELLQMRAQVRKAMVEGAAGLSFGLIYPPGCYAPTSELIALAEVAAEFGRPVTFHTRDEASRFEASVLEALEVGRRAMAQVHISHLKVTDPTKWGTIGVALAHLEAAHRRGYRVSCDQYPYTAGSTVFTTMLPPWALTEGTAVLPERLRDANFRARITAALTGAEPVTGWQSMVAGGRGWSSAQVGWAPGYEAAEGKTIEQLAGETNQTPVDAFIELLIKTNAGAIGVFHSMHEDDLRTVMQHPLQVIGSDGIPTPGKPHPRLYGTFPRVLGRYARELGVLSLAAAVYKMTGQTAKTFGLRNRGRIAPGYFADICVFDAEKIIDRATWTEPRLAPEGIEYVFCNGVATLSRGARTKAVPGRYL